MQLIFIFMYLSTPLFYRCENGRSFVSQVII